MSKPSVQRDGDTWVFAWSEHDVGMAFDAVKESSSTLKARVQVESNIDGRVLGPVNVDILGMRAQTEFANACHSRVNGLSKEQWHGLVVQACAIVAKQFNDPGPLDDLSLIDTSEPIRYLDGSRMVPENETTVLYGDGESAKSLLALRFGYSVASGIDLPWGASTTTGNVLYLDWETNNVTTARRLKRLAIGEAEDVPKIFYRQCIRSIVDELSTIREDISRKNIAVVIVDSISFAASGSLNDDETARTTMNAIRSMSQPGRIVTRIGVAHISKSQAEAAGGKAKPFGSAFFWNGMRSGIEVRKSEENSSENLIDLGIYHWKSNDGRHAKPFGLSVQFDTQTDGILFQPSSIDESPDLAARTPLGQRIRNMLKHAPGNTATTHMLSEELDVPENVLRVTLGRMDGIVKVSDGGGRGKAALWGLEV